MLLSYQFLTDIVQRQALFVQAAMPLYWFGGALFAILCLWLALYLVDRFKLTSDSRVSPGQNLYSQLCETHELSRSEINELRSLVDLVSHASPAVIFVRPDLLAEGCRKLGLDSVRAGEWQIRLFGEAIASEVDLAPAARHENSTSPKQNTSGLP